MVTPASLPTVSDPTQIEEFFATYYQGPYLFVCEKEGSDTTVTYSPSTHDDASHRWLRFGQNDPQTLAPVFIKLSTFRSNTEHFFSTAIGSPYQVQDLGNDHDHAILPFPLEISQDDLFEAKFWKYSPGMDNDTLLVSAETLSELQTEIQASHRVRHVDLDSAIVDGNFSPKYFAIIHHHANLPVWYSGVPSALDNAEFFDMDYSNQQERAVEVDATIQVSTGAGTQNSRDLLDDIRAQCQALDVSSFQQLGQLSDYRSLVDKALEVSAQTHVFASSLDDINLDDVQAMASNVATCLQSLTHTLHNSVSIDDTGVLTKIRDFLTAFGTLQTTLQQFQLQISVTNHIQMPDTLLDAKIELENCELFIGAVMQSLKHFVELDAPDAVSPNMSTARQAEITAAEAALDAIIQMGTTVVNDYSDHTVQEVITITDRIHGDTFDSLTEISEKLNSQSFEWIKNATTFASSTTLPEPVVAEDVVN